MSFAERVGMEPKCRSGRMPQGSRSTTSSCPQPLTAGVCLGRGPLLCPKKSPVGGLMVLRHCLKTNTLLPVASAARVRRLPPARSGVTSAKKGNEAARVRARREARRGQVGRAPGFLRDLRVAKATQDKYMNVLSAVALHSETTVDLLLTEVPEVVDAYAESYVEHRFACNGDRSGAGYVLAAIAHFFVWSLRDPNVLPLTKASVQGWKRFEPDSARLPCPWVVVLLISRWLAQRQDASMLQSARAVVLQFGLMARPGEIVGVMTDAVCLPRHRTSGADGTAAVIFAPSDEVLPLQEGAHPALTKTGEQDDTVAVDSAW